jgi:Fur family ferric uptake transcriptional regulator
MVGQGICRTGLAWTSLPLDAPLAAQARTRERQAGYDQAILARATAKADGHAMTHSDELKSSGLKATLPRIKILEIFQRTARRHMTAEDVYKALLIEGADIGLATVYRVLMQFEQAGLLTRSNFESGKAVFELNEGQHHDHLVCLDCGRVEEFFDAEIEQRQRAVTITRGFELQEHTLALYARCTKPDCAHKSK